MSLLDCTRVTATVGGKEIILETGRLARQAAGAIWIQCEGTVCFTTVCETPLDTPKDFFPLTVEYVEKMYAAGRIPGNFFRREIGRPSDNETHCSQKDTATKCRFWRRFYPLTAKTCLMCNA